MIDVMASASTTAPRQHRRLRRLGGMLGSLLAVVVTLSVLHALGIFHEDRHAIGGIAVAIVVLGLLVGPWFARLARSLSAERAARIREQERAEVAAHLHDSVLQTLALIQKRAGDPREVAGLARRQERELRHWLLERPGQAEQDSVASALERAAAEVEELHRVPIEVVTVGDAPLDVRLEALVQAAREALTNAAKFAGSERVDLYAEVDANARVEVFVRDRGVGFDPATIPPDRRGVRDSIVGRMERYGGHASIRSESGQGTEVELIVERGRGDRGQVAMSPVGSP
jgi:signal transduction histidine kinase